jgi:hypothetical protein
MVGTVLVARASRATIWATERVAFRFRGNDMSAVPRVLIAPALEGCGSRPRGCGTQLHTVLVAILCPSERTCSAPRVVSAGSVKVPVSCPLHRALRRTSACVTSQPHGDEAILRSGQFCSI